MASPGGEDLIGWHVNRGWSQQADFFPASRFSARFNRPDIVQLVLKTRDEAEAIKQGNETARRNQDSAPLTAQLPPVTAIVAPAPGARFSGDAVEVSFTVRSPTGLQIDGVQVLIDGRPVETRGLAPAASQTAGSSDETRHLTIPAPPHDFELALIARAGTLVGEAAKIRFVYAGAAPADAATALKPKLYAVTIGVSDYADEALRLGYAAADARGFAEALRRQNGGLYSDVEVRQFIDAIDASTIIGLRDRALIGLMVYSFARIGAAIGMRVEDLFQQDRRPWVRLHQKGGKQHAMPCHHNLESYLHEYIDRTGLASDPKALLFQTYSRATGQLAGNPLPQAYAYAMNRKRHGDRTYQFARRPILSRKDCASSAANGLGSATLGPRLAGLSASKAPASR